MAAAIPSAPTNVVMVT